MPPLLPFPSTFFKPNGIFAANARHREPSFVASAMKAAKQAKADGEKIQPPQDAASRVIRAIATWESAHERGLAAIAALGTACSFMLP